MVCKDCLEGQDCLRISGSQKCIENSRKVRISGKVSRKLEQVKKAIKLTSYCTHVLVMI